MKNLFHELATSQRFIEEAHALAALSHPNIVPIYDLIVDDDYWLVMVYLPGGSLADLLNREGFLEHERAVPILRDVARALAAAHKKGFIHRDVKPGNVLFDEESQVKVTDFGIAKSARSTVETTVGVTLGSPTYLSPEQIQGERVTPQSDVYALGITAYETLTGKRPLEGDQQQVLAKHLREVPEPLTILNPTVPSALNTFVLLMLSKRPEDRPIADDFVETIHRSQHPH